MEGPNRPVAGKTMSPSKRQDETFRRNINKLLEEQENGILEMFRAKYFTLPDTDDMLALDPFLIKASTFYAAGYDAIRNGDWYRPKPALAWLGEDLLNLRKAYCLTRRNGHDRLFAPVAFEPAKNNRLTKGHTEPTVKSIRADSNSS